MQTTQRKEGRKGHNLGFQGAAESGGGIRGPREDLDPGSKLAEHKEWKFDKVSVSFQLLKKSYCGNDPDMLVMTLDMRLITPGIGA